MGLLTPGQAAKRLNVARATLTSLITSGSLPAICLKQGKHERLFRIKEEVLERWLKERERETARMFGRGHRKFRKSQDAGAALEANNGGPGEVALVTHTKEGSS